MRRACWISSLELKGPAWGFARAGFEVHCVDIEDHARHAEVASFTRADAMDVLDDVDFCRSFDAIAAAPPCQRFTAYRRRGAGVGDSYPDLIEPVRERLQAIGRPWVIENVPSAPLRSPIQLCGSSFGLDVRRHRLFETSFPILAPPCDHTWQKPRFAQATNRTNLRSTVEVGVWRIPLQVQQQAMGIDWMDLTDLTEAIPPAYSRFIGQHLLDLMGRSAA